MSKEPIHEPIWCSYQLETTKSSLNKSCLNKVAPHSPCKTHAVASQSPLECKEIRIIKKSRNRIYFVEFQIIFYKLYLTVIRHSRFLSFFKNNTPKWQKGSYRKKCYCETENSDEEFYFDSLNTDSDVESDNFDSDSGCDIVPLKRRVIKSSDKEERLNSKLHILRHCQNVKNKDCFVC